MDLRGVLLDNTLSSINVDKMKLDHHIQHNNKHSLTNSPNLSVAASFVTEQMEATFQQDQEYLRLQDEYPSVWEAAIGNKGKQIAVFDKAQQQRNRQCIFKNNKEELIHVYVLTTFKSFIQPTIYKLNMIKLLKNQEVLAIGFNESIENE